MNEKGDNNDGNNNNGVISTTINNGKSENPTSATVAAATGEKAERPTSPKFSVADTPRWRFINQARKSEGYSSTAAGSFVKGLSAKELVDQYKVPEWKVAKEALIHSAKDLESSVKWDKGVGETTNKERERKSVGRLRLNEGGGAHVMLEEAFEFAGSRQGEGAAVVQEENQVPAAAEAEKEEQEEDAIVAVQEEVVEEDKIVDEEVPSVANELATQEGESLETPLVMPLAVVGDVQKLKDLAGVVDYESAAISPITEPEIAIVAAAPNSADDDELDQAEKQAAVNEPKQQAAAALAEEDPKIPEPETTAPTTPFSSYHNVGESPKPSGQEDERPERKKKRWALLLLLLVVTVTIAVVLGVVLGGNKSEEENASDKALGADDISSETTIDPKVPFLSPTIAPSTYCPANTKLLSVQHSTNDTQDEQFWKNFRMTWVVRDACSGEEMLRCLPCANTAFSPTTSAPTTSSPTLSPTTAAPITSKPTNSPSTSPSTSRPSSSPRTLDEQCIGSSDRPRPVRNGERFRFNIVGASDAGQCVDDGGRLYERGAFDDVDTFSDCANKCVQDTSASLAFNPAFRGYDYDCSSKSCFCLYDEGTLDETNDINFDTTIYGGLSGVTTPGSGEINGTAYKVGYYGYYCGKLVGVDEEEGVRRVLQEEDNVGMVEGYMTSTDGVSGCLPDGNEYVFEVKQSDRSGECCGFAPDSFEVTYGNIVVMQQRETTGTSSVSLFSNTTESIEGSTYFAERSEPCPSFNPSTMPTVSPTQPIRDVVHSPSSSVIPCRESIESDMAGRINGLSGKFCGFCQWKEAAFNCYKRVEFLVVSYDLGYVEARESLLGREQCTVPEDGVPEGIQAEIEKTAYCGNVPIIADTEAVAQTQEQT